MDAHLAKLKALHNRVLRVQQLHASPPAEIFNALRDQFLVLAEKLKTEYDGLEDFTPQNYDTFKRDEKAYFKWGTRALMDDINYFIDFLTGITSVHVPNVEVSDEGIYFSGQHFDALMKFNKIIAEAKGEIVLIDNYVNESILEILASKDGNVNCKVLTLERSYSKALQGFVEAFNKQYGNLQVRTSSAFHDRFVIVDRTRFYHFGASIKDAGNKGFMFSKIEQDFIQRSLLEEFEAQWNE